MIIAMQQRVVMPRYLNDNGDLFGGDAMKWMDEVAYIAARKYTNQKLVTVTVEKIRFLKPLKAGDFIEIRAEVKELRGVKLMVQVVIEKGIQNPEEIIIAMDAMFVFAAVDENGRPVRI
ncbi:MAG: acyl-CoA thioesterase [Bacteroidetes bacterium]|nr:MAG: acyl-CoA thioesterase [Bacteroidota bacterium]